MSSLLKRHSTLLAFTLSIASSVAFVACGDDDPTPTDKPDSGDGSGGKATGGAKASGGSSSGGAKASGGTSGAGGGPSSGGTTGTGGKATGGTDVGSNGDAASDAADD